MTNEDQIRIASEFAAKKGWPVQGYKATVSLEGTTAHVRFANPSGAPGDHLTVIVDTSTATATGLIPGR
jgi:hypothetical protein